MLAVGIGLLITLINSRVRLHPFIALVVVAVLVGLVSQQPVADIADSLESGAGDVLGNVGVTLALGTMLGRLLADSGATDRIAGAIIVRSGPRSLPWLITAAAFVIGIPMFFEIGLIVLLPLVFGIGQRLERARGAGSFSWATLFVPAVAALATLHGMVPPHPGPLVAVAGLHADLGVTIALGVVCAIPTVVVAGPLYARFIAPRVAVHPDAQLVTQLAGRRSGSAGTDAPDGADAGAGEFPSGVPIGRALVAILLPVVLMLLHALGQIVLDDDSAVLHVLAFLGAPVVAMLVGVLYALAVLTRRGTGDAVRDSLGDSLRSVVGILLIIAGGGAFNQVLEDSGIGKAVTTAASGLDVPVLLLGWLLALVLSASTGSATVGIVSATGVVAPLAAGGGTVATALLVIAVGAGSIGLNYVNHAGFWLVKESFGMTLGQATRTHTAVQTIVSVMGLLMASLLSVLLT